MEARPAPLVTLHLDFDMTTPSELRSKLTGVIGFPVTIFKDDYSLDLDGLRKNLKVMLQEPFSAIVAAGGTGELYSLTPDEHKAVVETTMEEVNGSIPVIAGAGYGTAIGTQLAKQSAELGVDGILAFPPYYPNAHIDGMVDYYRAISDASDLGMLIYSRDWAKFTPAQAERLASIDKLVAWKGGTADIRSLQIIMQAMGDRYYWIGGAGDDMVAAYYNLGIRTYTSSISNVAPKLSIALHELGAARKDQELQKIINELVVPCYEFRTRRKGYEVSAMKRLMDYADGLIGGLSRPPLVEVLDSEEADLKAILASWKDWM